MRTVDTKKDVSGLAGTSVPAADLLEKEPQAVLHPANTQQEANQRSLRGTLSGTARFESGQRESTVQNFICNHLQRCSGHTRTNLVLLSSNIFRCSRIPALRST